MNSKNCCAGKDRTLNCVICPASGHIPDTREDTLASKSKVIIRAYERQVTRGGRSFFLGSRRCFRSQIPLGTVIVQLLVHFLRQSKRKEKMFALFDKLRPLEYCILSSLLKDNTSTCSSLKRTPRIGPCPSLAIFCLTH